MEIQSLAKRRFTDFWGQTEVSYNLDGLGGSEAGEDGLTALGCLGDSFYHLSGAASQRVLLLHLDLPFVSPAKTP